MQQISLSGEEDHLPRRMVESRMLYVNQKEGLSCDAPRFLSKRLFAESTHLKVSERFLRICHVDGKVRTRKLPWSNSRRLRAEGLYLLEPEKAC